MRDDRFSRRSLLKASGALAGASLLPGIASAGSGGTGYETTKGESKPKYDLGDPYHVYVPTEYEGPDGTESPKLYAEVIRPVYPEGHDKAGEFVQDVPVILTYSPYNDLRSPNRQSPDPLDPLDYDPESGKPPSSEHAKADSTAHDPTATYFVPRGYARVMVDLVGTRNSQGTYDYGGLRERKSGKELVEWFAARDWSNDKVGMVGGSYDGTTQWAAAIEQPDGLATIVPQVAIDRWYDYAYIGGVRFESYGTPQAFDFGFALAPPIDADPEAVGAIVDRIKPGDRVEHELESSEYDELYDAFWDERDYKKDADNIECSAYVEGGWHDLNVERWDSTRMWQALPDDHPKKLVMGQWGHNTNQLEDALDVRHAWFDYWLKGIDTGVMDLPRVDSEINTGERFQHEQFPPQATEEIALPMVRYDPAPGELELLGTAQPLYEDTLKGLDESDMLADQSSGDDHLMFETPPVSEAMRFTGTPLADLVMTTTDDSTHVVGLLYQRAPDGSTERIASGALNAKNRNSLRRHDAVPTDQPFRVPLELIDIDHEVPKGHRLGLVVAADNTSRVRRDPDGSGTQEVVLRAPDASGGSTLRLPVTGGKAALGPTATAIPEVSVSRRDDGLVFTAGQTDQVTVTLDEAEAPVRLRDRIPEGWSVVGGQGTRNGDYVELPEAGAGETLDYFVEAPSGPTASGQHTFGPLEYSPDDGATWLTLPGTTETNVVVGVSTTLPGN